MERIEYVDRARFVGNSTVRRRGLALAIGSLEIEIARQGSTSAPRVDTRLQRPAGQVVHE